jgi:WD40 repeat protein
VDTILQVLDLEAVSVRQLQPQMNIDLATICHKCLQKEPHKRYASALELAEDCAAFLAGKPIRARPVGKLEQGWRWCRRNPTVASLLSLVVLTLVAGVVVATTFAWQAERAGQKEAEARKTAQQQLVEMNTESGLTAASRDDHSLALLWFARAVQLSHDEPAQQEINRIRMANWLRQVWLPEATFTLPEFRERQDLLRSFQFSPDGKYLLVLPTKGDCLVWDCQASRLVVLPPVAARSLVAAWQPRGGLLAVADKEGPIRFLAPPEFRPVGEVVAKGQVTVLAFSRDGNRLAWGGVDGARVWDLTKKMDVSPFFPHGAVVAGLSFSASGNLLATATRDNKARVFRIGPDSAEPLFPPVEHVPMEDHIKFNREWLGEEKQCALFADNDRVLLTASNREDRTQLVWRSTTTGKVLLAVETPYLSAFSVNPDGTKVAVIGIGTGRLWDASSRQFLAAIPQSNFSWCEDVRFSADGQTLTTGNEAEVHFWSVFDRRGDSLSPSSPFILHPKQVVRATHSPDGQHLAVALWDGRICLWHMPQGPPLTFTLDCGHPNVPAVSPDHSFVLPRSTSYREATQKQVRVYEAESGKAAGPILDPGGIVIDAAFNPEGTRVASASLTAQTTKERKERIFLPEGKAGNIQIWNWKSGERVAGPVPMPTEPRGLAYRPDGKTLAVVCADYRVLLLDPKDGRILHHLETGVHPHRDANLWWPNGDPRFSPDGRFLVTWEAVPFVQVWDPDQGRLLHRLDHEARIHQVAFSPTSSVLLATACRDRVARIWDLESGKLLKQMLHPHEVLRVRFSPDGKELITSCEDGSLRVWDWQQEKLLYAHSQHRMPMRDFGITADQRWLVTLGNQELQVTDWQTRSLASPLWNLPEPIRFALALAGEDHRVIVGGFSDSLEAYDLKAMTTPAPGAAEDLVRLAELAAGRRILPAGQVIPLNSAEWAERWERLQQGAIRGNSAP